MNIFVRYRREDRPALETGSFVFSFDENMTFDPNAQLIFSEYDGLCGTCTNAKVESYTAASGTPSPTNEIFVRRLRELRKKFRLSEFQVAEFLNIPTTLYHTLESGTLEPGLSTVAALTKLFGVHVDYLLGLCAHNDFSEKPPSDEETANEHA